MYLMYNLDQVGKIIEGKTKIFNLKEFGVKIKVRTEKYLHKSDFNRGVKVSLCTKTLCVYTTLITKEGADRTSLNAYNYYYYFPYFDGLLFRYKTEKQCIAESAAYRLINYLYETKGLIIGEIEEKRDFYYKVLKAMYGDKVKTDNLGIRMFD